MTGKSIDGVVQALIEVAVGKVQHLYRGTCPDAIEGFDSRDPQCPACRVLIAAQQQGQAVACVCCEDKPAPGNNPCGWCGRTAPQSAPVGVDAPGSRAWMAEVCRAAALSLAAHGVRNDQLSKVADWIAQQPAAVDEAMVFRLAVWMAKQDGHDDPHHLILEGSPPEPWGEIWTRYEGDARSALTAALATQHQEPKS